MLQVDLGRLARETRLTISERVPADDPLWERTTLRLRGPLAVRLEAQKAGADVLVRGELQGELEVECRRCLEPVVLGIDEPVSLLFRAGLTPVEAEQEEMYALPPRAQELDLSQAVREHVLLAVPKYALCREDCRGLCPQCGTNWNEASCTCASRASEDRWAALKKLKLD